MASPRLAILVAQADARDCIAAGCRRSSAGRDGLRARRPSMGGAPRRARIQRRRDTHCAHTTAARMHEPQQSAQHRRAASAPARAMGASPRRTRTCTIAAHACIELSELGPPHARFRPVLPARLPAHESTRDGARSRTLASTQVDPALVF